MAAGIFRVQKWPEMAIVASIIIVHLLFSTVIWKRVSRVKTLLKSTQQVIS